MIILLIIIRFSFTKYDFIFINFGKMCTNAEIYVVNHMFKVQVGVRPNLGVGHVYNHTKYTVGNNFSKSNIFFNCNSTVTRIPGK